MRKRKEYEFLIETTEFPGKGIAFYEGQKVAIKNTLPGQKVRGKVTKKNSNGVEARLMEVLEDVDYKIKPHCDISDQCGGCSHAFLDYDKQLALKEEQVKKLLDDAEIEGYEFLGIEGSPRKFQYRNKMEFTFGDMEKNGELTLGMHVKNKSFSIITVDQCKIVDEDFGKILKTTLDHFRKTDLPYYKVLKQEGFLRNLVIRKAINTGEILVNIVTTTQREYDFTTFTEEIKNLQLEGKVTGIIHTINNSLSDVVQADEIEILYGREYIIENLLGLNFKINPFAFFQTNSKGAEELYSIVRDFMGNSDNKVVFDLYCGTGTIGQIVAPKAKQVIGIELIEEAVEAAKENAKLNNLNNCQFIAGDVAKVIQDVKAKPDIIILDPPRAGVHPVALDYVIKFNAKEIIYVSCNPKTLATDLKVLKENGYKIEKIKLKDMFPHTPHCEAVVKLTKK